MVHVCVIRLKKRTVWTGHESQGVVPEDWRWAGGAWSAPPEDPGVEPSGTEK